MYLANTSQITMCMCIKLEIMLYILFFRWTIPIFLKGYRKDLEISDLPETLKTHKSEKLGNKLATAWEQEQARVKIKGGKGKPSLTRTLGKVFGLEIMAYGVLLASVEIGIRLVKAFLWYAIYKII